jgi:uncharacterized membrane protein YedE/YeeE
MNSFTESRSGVLSPPASTIDALVVAIALGIGLVGMAYATIVAGARQAVLFGIGIAMGFVLYRASFGFAGVWRRFLLAGDGRGIRAQMIMLAIAVCLFFPALARGQLFGRPVVGFVMPAGINVVIGAFVFGIGMQTAGGCASGTLMSVGGGNLRMMVTLMFFVLGSTLGTYFDADWWISLPSFGSYSLIEHWGMAPALVMSLSLFAAIGVGSLEVERRKYRGGRGDTVPSDGRMRPWPIVWGAIGLAILNFATLAAAGHPWGITSGFMLWGTKWLSAFGVDMSQSSYWQNQMDRIGTSVWTDVTSVMDFGIVLGAMLASGLMGRFKPTVPQGWNEVVSAVIGGLLLGYGARLAFGCNIGALFSGIASGSLHGWLWLVCGFCGNVVGLRLQRLL